MANGAMEKPSKENYFLFMASIIDGIAELFYPDPLEIIFKKNIAAQSNRFMGQIL